MTDQSNDTNIHLGEPMSFTEVTYKSVDEELLTGAEMAQRQLGPHLSMGDSS